MMYYSDKARERAIASIEKEMVALGNVPGNVIDHTSVESIIRHLDILKAEIWKEIGQ